MFTQRKSKLTHFNTKNLEKAMGGGYIWLNFKTKIMKTKNFIAFCTFLIIVMYNQKATGQTFIQFENQLPCDVEIHIEDYGPPLMPGQPCTVCNWGTVNVPANSIVSYSLCGSVQEICIVVKKVDGVTITWYNHAFWGSGNFCHGGPGNWITGQTGTSGNCTWTGGFNANGWIIN